MCKHKPQSYNYNKVNNSSLVSLRVTYYVKLILYCNGLWSNFCFQTGYQISIDKWCLLTFLISVANADTTRTIYIERPVNNDNDNLEPTNQKWLNLLFLRLFCNVKFETKN